MSRTALGIVTASLLAVGSIAVMATRYRVLGDEVNLPGGSGTWKITMLVQGRSAADAHLWTATPLDLAHQHIVRETARSDEFQQKPQEHHADRREQSWTQTPGTKPGPFRIRYECYCRVDAEHTGAAAQNRSHHLYSAPKDGDHLQTEPGIERDHPEIADRARRLTDGMEGPADRVEALFQFVDQQITGEPAVAGSLRSAVECLRDEGGDSAAKSRLLVALCRNRGIPARLVKGLTLARGDEHAAHTWVEAYVRSTWMPMCPFYHHFGRVPKTYLVFAYGDQKLVRGKSIQNLEQAFLVERVLSANADAAPPTWWKRAFRAVALHSLPLAEQQLIEFLLLLPLAALIICVFRNVVGLPSYGTFAPALIGLAFRDLRSWPGILVFVGIVLIGWLLRRVLNRFHLLQVPRTALMLSMVISLIIIFVIVSNRQHLPATKYISLFPLVILTSMIERFWTLEEEDGTRASFRTLLTTLGIAVVITLVISRQFVMQHMLRYPETVGLIMACQLILGRYTGYRVTELYRFRDFLREPAPVLVTNVRSSFGSDRF
ncbi:MAG: 7TM domain-containing protein [Gemmataceae bacterium]